MHGGLSRGELDRYHNEQHRRAMNAPIETPEHRARKAGL
jgi:hypothetical protein